MSIVALADIKEAQVRLQGIANRTSLIEFPGGSGVDNCRKLYLKLENQ